MTYLVARGPAQATTAQARTAATLALVAIGLAVLVLVARPLNAARAALVGCMAGGAVLIWAVPLSRRIFTLEWPPAAVLWATAGIVVLAVPILWKLVGVGARLERASGPGRWKGRERDDRGPPRHWQDNQSWRFGRRGLADRSSGAYPHRRGATWGAGRDRAGSAHGVNLTFDPGAGSAGAQRGERGRIA